MNVDLARSILDGVQLCGVGLTSIETARAFAFQCKIGLRRIAEAEGVSRSSVRDSVFSAAEKIEARGRVKLEPGDDEQVWTRNWLSDEVLIPFEVR